MCRSLNTVWVIGKLLVIWDTPMTFFTEVTTRNTLAMPIKEIFNNSLMCEYVVYVYWSESASVSMPHIFYSILTSLCHYPANFAHSYSTRTEMSLASQCVSFGADRRIESLAIDVHRGKVYFAENSLQAIYALPISEETKNPDPNILVRVVGRVEGRNRCITSTPFRPNAE